MKTTPKFIFNLFQESGSFALPNKKTFTHHHHPDPRNLPDILEWHGLEHWREKQMDLHLEDSWDQAERQKGEKEKEKVIQRSNLFYMIVHQLRNGVPPLINGLLVPKLGIVILNHKMRHLPFRFKRNDHLTPSTGTEANKKIAIWLFKEEIYKKIQHSKNKKISKAIPFERSALQNPWK